MLILGLGIFILLKPTTIELFGILDFLFVATQGFFKAHTIIYIKENKN